MAEDKPKPRPKPVNRGGSGSRGAGGSVRNSAGSRGSSAGSRGSSGSGKPKPTPSPTPKQGTAPKPNPKPKPAGGQKPTPKPKPRPAGTGSAGSGAGSANKPRPMGSVRRSQRPAPVKGGSVPGGGVKPETSRKSAPIVESSQVEVSRVEDSQVDAPEVVTAEPIADPTEGMSRKEKKRWLKQKCKEEKRNKRKGRGKSNTQGTAVEVAEGDIFESEDDLDLVLDQAKEVAETSPPKKKKSLKFKLIVAILLILTFVVGVLVAYKQVINPKTSDVEDALSGSYNLLQWNESVKSGNSDLLATAVEGSYLAQESDYASSSEFKTEFYKVIMNTVNYKVPEVELTKSNGKPIMVHDKPKMVMSDLMNGESVQLQVIDWTKLNFTKDEIVNFKDNHEKFKNFNLTSDTSYAMQELFAAYVAEQVNSPKPGAVVITTKEWVPQLEPYETVDSNGDSAMGMRVSKAEDIALDNLLFGSKEFLDAQARFYSAYFNKPIPDEWATYIKDTEAKKVVPTSYLDTMNPNWIGAYRLQVQIVEEGKASGTEVKPILPSLGDGTKENPAGLNTSVRTSYISGTKVFPVRIELTEFKMDQDAIDFFNSKDSRNFGFSTESQRVYASGKLLVTNVSAEEFTVKEDTAIVDDQLNQTASTGTVYGLKREATLKPGDTVELDFWASSTEINSRYLIWGKSFNRQEPAVWFRVLNAEDGTVEPVQGTAMNPSTSASPTPSVGTDG